jgi:6-phosphofructokinase 1
MTKKIAVMTTGGDACGMNSAIRSVVRTAISEGIDVYGIEEGLHGLLNNRFIPMDLSSVGGIINRGGTILKTVRSMDFHDRSRRSIAYRNLEAAKIDGIVSIGGDGSRKGMYTITKESGIPSVFVPASIDNDVSGTDITIGFDTAVNVALDAVDKIRDTAASHERIFIVEVMGREHGFLALEVGLTGGAEIILIPELKEEMNISKMASVLNSGIKRGKKSSIIVMAEGVGPSADLADKIEKATGMEARLTVLGYIQRGGTPTAYSRKLGIVFGYEAVMALKRLKQGESRMTAISSGMVKVHDTKDFVNRQKKIDMKLYKMNSVLSL